MEEQRRAEGLDENYCYEQSELNQCTHKTEYIKTNLCCAQKVI